MSFDLTKKEDTEDKCPLCQGVMGIYFISGGLALFCNNCKEGGEILEKLPNKKFIMPFGKHKGKLITQIPRDYLEWAVSNLSNKSIVKRFEEVLSERKNRV